MRGSNHHCEHGCVRREDVCGDQARSGEAFLSWAERRRSDTACGVSESIGCCWEPPHHFEGENRGQKAFSHSEGGGDAGGGCRSSGQDSGGRSSHLRGRFQIDGNLAGPVERGRRGHQQGGDHRKLRTCRGEEVHLGATGGPKGQGHFRRGYHRLRCVPGEIGRCGDRDCEVQDTLHQCGRAPYELEADGGVARTRESDGRQDHGSGGVGGQTRCSQSGSRGRRCQEG
mmetsp:Transcript_17779/g.47959  ORF Transcript_17779/g.47959 Transcript_17779/m.47959 type:complete len:228 (+) Transcript_17779:1919-2602(+)